MTQTNWRDIPCASVDWAGWSLKVTGTKRGGHALTWKCRENAFSPDLHKKTLGDLANMGERAWRRLSGVGDKGVQTIMAVIDAAAEGQEVSAVAVDAYIPKCERGDATSS